MKYVLLAIPDYAEPTVEEFATKKDMIKRLGGFVEQGVCVFVIRGERLHIGRDRGTKQLFLLEDGHLPMPILVPGGIEVINDGRLGGHPEPDADYLSATKSSHERPTKNKRVPDEPVEEDVDDDDDDDDL